MKKIIVFDGQVFQTSAWDRGMGKYSLCLVDSILLELQNSDEINVYLVLTKNLPLSKDAKLALEVLDSKVKHVYLDLLIPKTADVTQHIVNRKANTVVLDDFIGTIEVADSRIQYVILALFIDQLCEVFPSKTENVLLFYDLIPLFYHEYYGIFPTYEMYLAQFHSLMSADKIMTISQTVADELSVFLGIPKAKLCNVDGGPIKRSHIKPVKPTSFNVPDEYMLMSTGNDMRKNNLRAVQGFEEYRLSSNNSNIYLVITSSFDDVTRENLLGYCDNIIFTGNIPEDELLWLYENMRSLLFIPESEGLGLPILEAVEANKPIVCSKIGPFLEMSEDAFYYTNHFDVSDIADAIAEALSGYGWADKLRRYPKIIDKYQWARTAKKAVTFLELAHKKRPASKPKIAIVGPDPSGYSAIGNKIQQAHPVLSEFFDVDYYIEKQKSGDLVLRPSYIEYVASARPVQELDLDTYSTYDYVIYHVGNSEFHMETIKKALYLPGYVFIHDTYLENIFSVMRTSGMISDSRYRAETELDKLLATDETRMLGSLLSNQLGVFVHSAFAKEVIEKLDIPGLKITQTVLASEVAAKVNPRLSKKVTIGLAGIIHPIKGIDLIRRLAQRFSHEDVQFEIFGMAMVSQEYVDKLSSLPNVQVSTNLTDYQFQLKLAQLDIIINYRAEYHGETSLSVIEAMRAGVVPIVRDIGWYSELPDDVVLKLRSTRGLVSLIEELLKDRDGLEQRSKKAKQYIKDNFTYSRHLADIKIMLSSKSDNKVVLNIASALRERDVERALDIVKGDET